MRLRQAVLVASELEPVVEALTDDLALEEPFRDPGVAEFGLVNAVFALGDTFLEVVSPTTPAATAARYLKRRGADSGYMVIFDLEDLVGARERVEQAGVRVVWRVDLPDVSATHLHPVDMGGAIVSLDQSRPYGTWRWGGPSWTGRIGQGAAGGLTGLTVAAGDPEATAARWATVLGVGLADGPEPALTLEGAKVDFVVGEPAMEGICEVALELPAGVRRGREAIELGAVRLRLLEASA